MVSKHDINYSLELYKNCSINSIRESHIDNVLIWVICSGKPIEFGGGSYKCVIQYNNSVKLCSGNTLNNTANRSAIIGAIECVKQIKKQVNICVVSSTRLGFDRAFKNKGVNSDLLQELYKEILYRKCTLTEISCENSGETIRKYVDLIYRKLA